MGLHRGKPRLKEILDLEQLKKLLGHFSAVTGLDAVLFDFLGRDILSNRKPGSVCEAAGNCRKCRESISYGGSMALQLGEPYIFACGCGLIMCSSPVMFEDRLIGSIVCGPAMLWEADEAAVCEFREKTVDMNIPVDTDGLFSRIPSCGCVNMTGCAQILFIIVNSLSQNYSDYLAQRARITEQQARIAQMIIEQKSSAAASGEKEKHAPAPAYPAETERELLALVRCGNKKQADRTLDRLLSEFFSFTDGNLNAIRLRLIELAALFSRTALEAGAALSAVDRITENSFEFFKNDMNFGKFCYFTTEIMRRYIDAVSRSRVKKTVSRHLSRAIDYIGLNYADELSLTSVADAVFVSGYYLSHLFRKELNMTFSDYVCKIRIEKAKGLLKDDRELQIREITEKVGFNDPNYFTKSFKKLTGVPPKEYQTFS
ncbi:MAG: PocR ligand-binding domain-containing protein [Treponema sp.]|jgi:two-component system response regulator YesN|nr:PocR ligand-binding domain-containing protein [Treponema sp.]